jgi:hypothetical protein
MVIDLDQHAANADQIIMPIMQPIRLVERLEFLAMQPMQPRRAQRSLDVGFWNPMRNQIEMF